MFIPTYYGNQDVICPFYKEEDKLIIKCEGIVSQVCSQQFRTQKRKEAAKENFCNTYNYKSCPHFKAVEVKYKLPTNKNI